MYPGVVYPALYCTPGTPTVYTTPGTHPPSSPAHAEVPAGAHRALAAKMHDADIDDDDDDDNDVHDDDDDDEVDGVNEVRNVGMIG